MPESKNIPVTGFLYFLCFKTENAICIPFSIFVPPLAYIEWMAILNLPRFSGETLINRVSL